MKISFKVTHDISAYCKAAVFDGIGKAQQAFRLVVAETTFSFSFSNYFYDKIVDKSVLVPLSNKCSEVYALYFCI